MKKSLKVGLTGLIRPVTECETLILQMIKLFQSLKTENNFSLLSESGPLLQLNTNKLFVFPANEDEASLN